METIELPEYENRINEDFFAKSASVVAKGLLGRMLITQENGSNLYSIITEIGAYEGDHKTMNKRIRADPGTISVSSKFGKNLIDISTGKEYESSCITVRGIKTLDDELIKGPGNVSEYLGITKDLGDVLIGDSNLWVSGQRYHQNRIHQRNLSNVPENCKGIFYIR